MEQLGRERRGDTDPDTDEQLREVFERLNLTPEYELLITSPASSEDEEATPVSKLHFFPLPHQSQLPPLPWELHSTDGKRFCEHTIQTSTRGRSFGEEEEEGAR
jgi:hypothetical protein